MFQLEFHFFLYSFSRFFSFLPFLRDDLYFTDLLININLNNLYNIINDLFQKHFTNLELTKNIDIGYFKTVTKFIINNKFIMYSSKIYV